MLLRGSNGLIPCERSGHIHRPKLTAQPAFSQARNVGLPIIKPLADVERHGVSLIESPEAPGEVVVPIDEGVLGVNADRSGKQVEVLGRGFRSLPDRHEHGKDR